MKTKSAIYEVFKLVANPALKLKIDRQNLTSWLAHFYSLVKALSQEHEVKAWEKTDRRGNTYWNVYNPVTDKTVQFGSEAEVRIWLEQQYYR